jgi:hypothetical protein
MDFQKWWNYIVTIIYDPPKSSSTWRILKMCAQLGYQSFEQRITKNLFHYPLKNKSISMFKQ